MGDTPFSVVDYDFIINDIINNKSSISNNAQSLANFTTTNNSNITNFNDLSGNAMIKTKANIKTAVFSGIQEGQNSDISLPVVVGQSGSDTTGTEPLSIDFKPLFSNSKIKITVSVNCSSNDTINAPRFRIFRDSAQIVLATPINAQPNNATPTFATAYPNSNRGVNACDFVFIDTADNTTQRTYKVCVAIAGADKYFINYSDSTSNTLYNGRFISTLTVEELYG